MASTAFALVALCLVFIAYGIPESSFFSLFVVTIFIQINVQP
jgi:hypothetical protein